MACRLTDDEVLDRLSYYRQRLGIGPEWAIEIAIYNEPPPFFVDEDDCQAEIQIIDGALLMRISFWPYKFEREQLDAIIVHELVHFVLRPMAMFLVGPDDARECIEEQITERLARAITDTQNVLE